MSRNIFDHDPLCLANVAYCNGGAQHRFYDTGWCCEICGLRCRCDVILEAREDEREKAAERVLGTRWQWHSNDPEWYWDGCPCNACNVVDSAIAAVRGYI